MSAPLGEQLHALQGQVKQLPVLRIRLLGLLPPWSGHHLRGEPQQAQLTKLSGGPNIGSRATKGLLCLFQLYTFISIQPCWILTSIPQRQSICRKLVTSQLDASPSQTGGLILIGVISRNDYLGGVLYLAFKDINLSMITLTSLLL